MEREKVIIFGCKDLAELAWFYLTQDSNYEVIGFTLHEQYRDEPSFHGLPVYSFESLNESFSPAEVKLFAPMTAKGMNKQRENVYKEGKDKGYSFISYVSSKATVFPGTQFGENCFILENNTIQPFTTIGNNVVMWSGNHIGHHGKIDDHVFFTSHVVLSGHCHVKPYCFFGVNATIRDALVLEEGTFVAMAACVTKSTEAWGTYLGNPAKKAAKSSYDVY